LDQLGLNFDAISLSSFSFQNKPKQTDLFQNELKQTKNGLKNSNSTQKSSLSSCSFRNKTKNGSKTEIKTKKRSLASLDRLGLNFYGINLKF